MTSRSTTRLARLAAVALACAMLACATLVSASYIEEEFQAPPQPPRRVLPPRPPEPPRPPLPPEPPRPPLPDPPPHGHVPELAAVLNGLDVGPPAVYGRVAVFPLVPTYRPALAGDWLTLDDALRRGMLTVSEEPGGGQVPVVIMQSLTGGHVIAMAGEVIAGGKQTRTLREDVIVLPHARVAAPVLCVERHRWAGEAGFSAPGLMAPASIQKAVRAGADQSAVWEEVARSNAALGTENATGSLERSLGDAEVQGRLRPVRDFVVGRMPPAAVGYVFVDAYARRAVGLEVFGRADLARALLPKLVDAYTVDLVLATKSGPRLNDPPPSPDVARALLDRVRGAASHHAPTPGAGLGIRLRGGGLVGGGVSLGALVHLGVHGGE